MRFQLSDSQIFEFVKWRNEREVETQGEGGRFAFTFVPSVSKIVIVVEDLYTNDTLDLTEPD